MGRRSIGLTLAVAAMLVARSVVAAPTAEQKCQGAKNIAAGKYAACRQKAEKGLASTGDTAKYDTAITRCEDKLSKLWQKAIDKASAAGATCPDSPLTEGQYKTVIDEHCDNVAAALGGGGLEDCPADLTTCNGSLSTCNTNYSTCSSSLGTCNTNLTSCNGSLATCNAGTATTADVVAGKTFSSSAGLGLTGTATAGSNVTGANGSLSMTIPDAIYTGSKTATANDSNLVVSNIVNGVTIFNVTGTAGWCRRNL